MKKNYGILNQEVIHEDSLWERGYSELLCPKLTPTLREPQSLIFQPCNKTVFMRCSSTLWYTVFPLHCDKYDSHSLHSNSCHFLWIQKRSTEHYFFFTILFIRHTFFLTHLPQWKLIHSPNYYVLSLQRKTLFRSQNKHGIR